VNAHLRNETDYGVLGAFLGRHLADRIPLVKGIESAPESCLKQLCAALASTGMVNMFHTKVPSTKRQELERIGVEAKDLKKTADSLSTSSACKPDLVFVGCPHCSLNEMRHIAQLTEGRKVKAGTEFWICTSPYVKNLTREYVARIEKSGGHVLAGVCTVVSWTEKLGIKTIMTNSAKTAYYAPTLNKAETILAPLEQCLRTALEG
jgi:predicted aconitase